MRPPATHPRTLPARSAWWTLHALASLAILPACSTPQLDERAVASFEIGRYGPVASALAPQQTSDTSDKDYLLTRLRVLHAALAEGVPDAAEEPANQLFALLRTQGLNEDRTVASVVLSEGVRIWKGEPFEQALAYSSISIQKAMRAEWDNARAAANSSLFLLKDFSDTIGRNAPPTDLARRAAELDRESPGAGDELLDTGYDARPTDFALGYLLSAVANHALQREQESREQLSAAVSADPALEPLASILAAGTYNTILVVDYGAGPTKAAAGNDGSIALWRERTRSDARRINVLVNNTTAVTLAPVQDINRMAMSHRWNNLDDVRALKSALGDLLLAGGAVVATNAEDDDARWVGAAIAALGLFLKATSVADTRHDEFLPQRTYFVPVMLPPGVSTISLQIEGDSASRITLHDLKPPSGQESLQLRFVRIPTRPTPWQAAHEMIYANDFSPVRIEGDDLPFIFGGRCASRPSPRVMQRYHDAGNLSALTLTDLENLYREEGITWTIEDQTGQMVRHILDGGTSLIPPLPGTLGYQRLFAAPHEPYRPQTDSLRAAIAAEQARKLAPTPEPQ
jgi:hypothetical protein